jgi:hypothetical protein
VHDGLGFVGVDLGGKRERPCHAAPVAIAGGAKEGLTLVKAWHGTQTTAYLIQKNNPNSINAVTT